MMNKPAFSFLLLLMFQGALYAQTNTFPSSGNVGIGTTSPQEALHINGNVRGNGTGGALVVKTENGYTEIGPRNTGWSHFITDQNNFYFNKGVWVSGIFSSYYNNHLDLRTGGVSRIFANYSTGNIGIGTTTPSSRLELDLGSSRNGIKVLSDGDANAYSDITQQVKNPSGIPTGTAYSFNISHRKDGYFTNSSNSSLEFYAIRVGGGYFAPLAFKSNGDVILASNLRASSGNVGIGTTTPDSKLSVNGNIRAKEIKLETSNWPDYVFGENYRQLSLKEVEAFIKANGHLPRLKSAEAYEKEGVNMMELNQKLLEKIEELTLYTISQDEQISGQANKIKKLEEELKSVEKLEKELEMIKTLLIKDEDN